MNNVVLLNTGGTMPMLGLGTADPMHGIEAPHWVQGRFSRIRRSIYSRLVYKSLQEWRSLQLSLAVKKAIQLGYRLIDTSAAYNNETLIRRGIRWSGVPREELFIITRVSNRQQRAGNIRGALLQSLKNLGIDYVDLYMFHWPVPDVFVSTWRVMEELNREGVVKAIGVANCHRHHLETLLASATVTPAVNEFEIHPLLSQNELISFCSSKGITVIAYTPIGRFHAKLADNENLKSLASKYAKSVPQIILRWHFQKNITTIPRSCSTRHIKANISIFDFELLQDEMLQIDGINENLRLRYDPDNCDFMKL